METIQSIIDWQLDTFGPGHPDRLFDRAFEEWLELEEKMGDPLRDYRQCAMEVADVIIVLAGVLQALGYPNAVDLKMEVNRVRQWMTKGDGTGYHVKPEKG